MYPAIQNNGGLNGLNGFWGGLFKGLAKMVADMTGEIPLVGGYIRQQLTNFIDTNVNWNWRKADILLTDAEELILTQFTENTLSPFIYTLATDLSNALQSQSFEVQLNGINLALRRVCLLKTYYLTNVTKGLSEDAITARMELITEVLNPIETLIGETLLSKTNLNFFSKLTPFNANEFSGIIKAASSYMCNQYETQKGQPANTEAPISQQEIVGVVATPTTATIETKTDKKGGWLILFAILLVAIGLSDNKKEKK